MSEPVQDEHILQRNSSPAGVAPSPAEHVAAGKPVPKHPGAKLAAHHARPLAARLSVAAVAGPVAVSSKDSFPLTTAATGRTDSSSATHIQQTVRPPTIPKTQENHYGRGRCAATRLPQMSSTRASLLCAPDV